MEGYQFCQSCGMPLERQEDLGTEADGLKSTIYCIHCYRDGRFTDETMTLQRMRVKVQEQLAVMHADPGVILEAIERLPHLTRWLGVPSTHHSQRQ
jgi:hypothetical protein